MPWDVPLSTTVVAVMVMSRWLPMVIVVVRYILGSVRMHVGRRVVSWVVRIDVVWAVRRSTVGDNSVVPMTVVIRNDHSGRCLRGNCDSGECDDCDK